MKRLLRWLNRMPCGCTRTPDGGGVASDCWRHALLDRLCAWCILCDETESHYYHDARVEWRPWYWGARGYLRAHPDFAAKVGAR